MYLETVHRMSSGAVGTQGLCIPLPLVFGTPGAEQYLSWVSSCLQGLEEGVCLKSEQARTQTKAHRAWWGGAGLGLSQQLQGPQ